MRACPAKSGDHLEFFAEIDLLCALSTCPGGDLSVPLWGPDARDPLDSVARSVSRCTSSTRQCWKGWKPPESPAYKGAHGMKLQKPAWGRLEFVPHRPMPPRRPYMSATKDLTLATDLVVVSLDPCAQDDDGEEAGAPRYSTNPSN